MLTPTATSMFRSGVARSCGLQPMVIRAVACPYSTTAATRSPFSSPVPSPKKTPISRPSSSRPACKSIHTSSNSNPLPRTRKATTPTTGPSAILIRANSTKAPQSHPPSSSANESDAELDARAAAAAASAQQQAGQPTLDWNTFFALRRTRRRWQLGFSVATAVTAVGAEGGVLGTGAGSVLSESLTSALPLDPMITMGLATIVCFGLGWLIGPSIGSVFFNLSNAKYKKQMAAKEGQFFARIKKNRVDPTSSSTNNPVPDYYGEKISSVAGYRQWLKDQRAFNKKRTTFL